MLCSLKICFIFNSVYAGLFCVGNLPIRADVQQRQFVGTLWTGYTDSCEPSGLGAGDQTPVLSKNSCRLWSSEPSLQATNFYNKWNNMLDWQCWILFYVFPQLFLCFDLRENQYRNIVCVLTVHILIFLKYVFIQNHSPVQYIFALKYMIGIILIRSFGDFCFLFSFCKSLCCSSSHLLMLF